MPISLPRQEPIRTTPAMNVENTKAQMRKGVLEYCILGVLAQGELVAVCVTNDGKGGMAAAPIPDTFRAKIRMAPKQAWQLDD